MMVPLVIFVVCEILVVIGVVGSFVVGSGWHNLPALGVPLILLLVILASHRMGD